MTATASDPFFWNDYQGDPRLRACNFSAQGIWMRMLCLAAESTRYGYVLINGLNPTVEDLVSVIGGTVEEVTAGLAQLWKWGVYSKDCDNVIYCRRMVRAEMRREASAAGGKIGGKSTHGKQKGIFTTQDPTQGTTQDATQGPTQGVTQAPRRAPLPSPFPLPFPESSETIVSGTAVPMELSTDDKTWLFREGLDYLAAASQKPAAKLRPLLGMWLKQVGNDHGRLRGIIESAAQTDVASPEGWITQAIAARSGQSSLPHGEEPIKPDDLWRRRLERYKRLEVWDIDAGPKPDQRPNVVPINLLKEFGYAK